MSCNHTSMNERCPSCKTAEMPARRFATIGSKNLALRFAETYTGLPSALGTLGVLRAYYRERARADNGKTEHVLSAQTGGDRTVEGWGSTQDEARVKFETVLEEWLAKGMP